MYIVVFVDYMNAISNACTDMNLFIKKWLVDVPGHVKYLFLVLSIYYVVVNILCVIFIKCFDVLI